MSPLQSAIEDLLAKERQVEAVLSAAREIYRAGERAGAIYYVRTGMVKLSEDHGTEGGTVGVVSAGEIFGEEVLVGAREYRATATRLTNGEILRIPATLFPRVAARRQELWQGVAWLIDQRLRREQRSFRWLVKASTEERILATLNRLAPLSPVLTKLGSEQSWYGVPLTQAELAVMVGASRETTSSVLNEMERAGVLALKRGRILMPQPKAKATQAG